MGESGTAPSEVLAPTLSEELIRTLKHPELCLLFRDFLKEHYAGESLSFWATIQIFKKITDPDELKEKAENIFTKYFTQDSENEINVDYRSKERLIQKMKQPYGIELFDEVTAVIYSLLETECLSKFLKSPAYQDFMHYQNNPHSPPAAPPSPVEDEKEKDKKNNKRLSLGIFKKKKEEKDKDKEKEKEKDKDKDSDSKKTSPTHTTYASIAARQPPPRESTSPIPGIATRPRSNASTTTVTTKVKMLTRDSRSDTVRGLQVFQAMHRGEYPLPKITPSHPPPPPASARTPPKGSPIKQSVLDS
eukprot:TRINITY_DN3786_c0_g1_i1.p1 TRINITY_DN3786_c0_g1~~TRINITY_DN3786_c0_g1_i1.p1  ORF type:complete len:304 (-),score=64.54 TRINITY_DN3786_c0_g1_i1:92-1003(-)